MAMNETADNKDATYDFEAAIFIGEQHLKDIRDTKSHQRSILFQYIIISIALAGLTRIGQVNPRSIEWSIICLGVIVIGLILSLQWSLRNSRIRILKIWQEPYFKTALDKGFLNIDKKDPEKYCSFRYQIQYPLGYSLIIIIVAVSLLYVI